MKSDTIKIRNYQNSSSFGVNKEIANFLKEKGFEHFIIRCNDNGVVSFTPINILSDKLDELSRD